MNKFSTPSVAILVLNYNGEQCLSRCLSSLQTLDYPELQVAVIDNGSQDHSFQKAKQQFPLFHYIQKSTNTGFASGMNTGIEWALSQGYDFVWLMNYDADVFPETLTVLINAYRDNQNIQAMSPVILNSDKSIWYAGGKINFWRMRAEHVTELQSPHPYTTGFLTGCAPLFSGELLKKVGNFDERFFLYYEDADLSERIKGLGEKLFIIPGAKVAHAEKSLESSQKLYFLVFSGLLFFALHTPKVLRFYVVLYVTIRILVNKIKALFGLSNASLVAKAYADYYDQFQAGHKLYFRKLS